MNLIQIAIDDRHLVLPPDFSIRFTFNFPLPYLDNIPISSTYWFTIPVEGNEITFKHCNCIYITKKLFSYNCKITVAGLSFSGKLIIKNASNKEYKAFAVFNDFFETILDKKISEVVEDIHVLGTDTNSVIAAAKTMCESSWPNAKYAFPMIKNEMFYGDTNSHYLNGPQFMNHYPFGAFTPNSISNNEVYNENVLVPMPYLFFILTNIFGKSGWEINGSIINDVDFKKLIYFNNYHLENIADPNFINISFLERMSIMVSTYSILQFNNVISDENDNYNPSSFILTPKQSGAYYYSFNSLVTMIFGRIVDPQGKTFKILLYDGINYTLLFEQVLRNDEYQYEVNGYGYINLTQGVNYTFVYYTDFEYIYFDDVNFQLSIVSNGLNRFDNQIDLKNHVPRMNTSEFLSALVKKFSIAIFMDFVNKKIEFEHWNNIIGNQNYIDMSGKVIKDSEDITIEERSYSFITEWSADELIEGNFKDISKFDFGSVVITKNDLPTASIIGQICLVKASNKYYITYLNEDSNILQWKGSFDNFYDVISINKNAIEIKTILNTLFVNNISVYDTFVPVIKQMGSSPELGINDQGLKFLNYHGIDIYPFASNTNYLRNGSKTTGVPMQTHGIDGTYDRYCKKLYEYLKNADPIEMNLEITPADFVQIAKLFNAGNKERKIRVDAKNYIPETVDITVSMSKIESCKVKLL